MRHYPFLASGDVACSPRSVIFPAACDDNSKDIFVENDVFALFTSISRLTCLDERTHRLHAPATLKLKQREEGVRDALMIVGLR